MDPRIMKLAENLIRNSVRLQPGENILIQTASPVAFPLIEALIDAAYKAGGFPYFEFNFENPKSCSNISRAWLKNITEEQLALREKQTMGLLQKMQAYIAIRPEENQFEMTDIPPEKLALASKISRPSTNWRVEKTRWCVLRFPVPAMAQAAEMSTEAFEEFFFNCCLLDYSKMSKAMDALVELMQKTDKVKIIGVKGTNLTFSIKGIPAIKCAGECNIPDGEVFTAPVRDSINGTLYYTAPTIFESRRFGGIRLEFQNGKIIKATCEQGSNESLNEILERDEGARYVGEFALGVNPYIQKAMLNILFDEKISGSFHFTPGACYENQAPNGNKSQIHWDMVCLQTPEYGGGEIWFDGRMIRQDGRFIVPELEPLNPENLI